MTNSDTTTTRDLDNVLLDLNDSVFLRNVSFPRAHAEREPVATRIENGVTITTYPAQSAHSSQSMRVKVRGATSGASWYVRRTMEVASFREANEAPASLAEFTERFNKAHTEAAKESPAEPLVTPPASVHEAFSKAAVRVSLQSFYTSLKSLISTVTAEHRARIAEAHRLAVEMKTAATPRRVVIRKKIEELQKATPDFPVVFRRVYVPIPTDKLESTGFNGWIIRQSFEDSLTTIVATPVRGGNLGAYLSEKVVRGSSSTLTWLQVKSMLTSVNSGVVELVRVGG